MRFSRTSHFLGSFTRWIGFANVSGRISHSVALVIIPLMAFRRLHIACQEVHAVWSQSRTSLDRISLRRVSFHRGRMMLRQYRYFALVVAAIIGLPAASFST